MFLVAQFISANAFQSAQTRRIERNVQVKAAPTREELSFMLEKFGPTPELVMGIMFDKVSRQLSCACVLPHFIFVISNFMF